jgi:fluoroacetyl-CoA thioesterase
VTEPEEGELEVTALEPGLEGIVKVTVEKRMTATAFDSGPVDGLATPALVALMEAACMRAVAGAMVPGQSSVGVHLDVEHLAPTPVGMAVVVRARLERVENRKLHFTVRAEDEAGEIGRGTHERVLIDLERFEQRISRRGRGGLPA